MSGQYRLNTVVMRDSRLSGGIPQIGAWYGEVNQYVSLAYAWGKAANLAALAKTATRQFLVLKIMCHGYESGGHGGWGLQFCQDDVTLGNAGTISFLQGVFDCIDIMACAAADVSPGCKGVNGDGDLLCSRLAINAGCLVRASVVPQIYFTQNIDFADWEGLVNYYDVKGGMMHALDGKNNYR